MHRGIEATSSLAASHQSHDGPASARFSSSSADERSNRAQHQKRGTKRFSEGCPRREDSKEYPSLDCETQITGSGFSGVNAALLGGQGNGSEVVGDRGGDALAVTQVNNLDVNTRSVQVIADNIVNKTLFARFPRHRTSMPQGDDWQLPLLVKSVGSIDYVRLLEICPAASKESLSAMLSWNTDPRLYHKLVPDRYLFWKTR